MRRLQIRCHTCGYRDEVLLSDFDERNLRGTGHLMRFCKECRGNTRWDPQETTGRTTVTDAEPSESRGSILVIDDDDSILAILEKALTAKEFEVQTASSAREAIQLLARGDYNVILSDIRMPEFDGQQLFAFLDEHLSEHKDRVIFLTGDIQNPKTVDFLKEVGRPYLSKPIDLPKLFDLITRELNRPRG